MGGLPAYFGGMDTWLFYQTAAAVMAGNLLTAMFVYFVWSARKREMKGLYPWDLGFGPIVCGLIPPLIWIGAFLYLK
jgi:hypothetical protein